MTHLSKESLYRLALKLLFFLLFLSSALFLIICASYTWPVGDDLTWLRYLGGKDLWQAVQFIGHDWFKYSGRLIHPITMSFTYSQLDLLRFFPLIYLTIFLISLYLIFKTLFHKPLQQLIIYLALMITFFPKIITYNIFWNAAGPVYSTALLSFALFFTHYCKNNSLSLGAIVWGVLAISHHELLGLFIITFIFIESYQKKELQILRYLPLIIVFLIVAFAPGNFRRLRVDQLENIGKFSSKFFSYYMLEYTIKAPLLFGALSSTFLIQKNKFIVSRELIKSLIISSLMALLFIFFLIGNTSTIHRIIFFPTIVLTIILSRPKILAPYIQKLRFIPILSILILIGLNLYLFDQAYLVYTKCRFKSNLIWKQIDERPLNTFQNPKVRQCPNFDMIHLSPAWKKEYRYFFKNDDLEFPANKL